MCWTPLGIASKFMSISDIDFLSFGAPSWVPLGCHVGSFWRLGRPKLVLGPSSNHLIFEKVIFQKNERHCSHSMKMRSKTAQDGTPNGPRSLQDRSKIVLDRYFFLLIFRFDFGSLSDRFWCRFGLPNGTGGGPLHCANRPLVRFFFRLVVRDRFFGRLGLLLGSFLVVWGSS